MTKWNEETHRRIHDWMEVKTQGSFLSVQDVAAALGEIERLKKRLAKYVDPESDIPYLADRPDLHKRIKELEAV